MELIRASKGEAHIQVSLHELLILNNALNEVCNGIEVPEFETRMGVSLEQVEALLRSVRLLIDTLEAPGT